MKASEADLLADFEAGRIDPANFRHRDHVRVSYELLEHHPFPEALLHLARRLRRVAAKAGQPEVYHETITAAFLAVIAERRLGERYTNWENFARRNPDLFRKELLRDLPARSVAIIISAANLYLAAEARSCFSRAEGGLTRPKIF